MCSSLHMPLECFIDFDFLSTECRVVLSFCKGRTLQKLDTNCQFSIINDDFLNFAQNMWDSRVKSKEGILPRAIDPVDYETVVENFNWTYHLLKDIAWVKLQYSRVRQQPFPLHEWASFQTWSTRNTLDSRQVQRLRRRTYLHVGYQADYHYLMTGRSTTEQLQTFKTNM